MTTRWLSVFFLAFWLMPTPASSGQFFTNRFDEDIRSAVKRYGADFPFWLAWKSQLYQESHLDPTARSGVGAEGIAQFMGPTWADVTRQIGAIGADRRDAGVAIQAGEFLMAKLRQEWRRHEPQDRQRLALASYNAGIGSILKAQKACGDAIVYEQLAPCLVEVTGPEFSKQTRDYVSNIAKWWAMMETTR